MTPTELLTERLLLRQWGDEDLDPFVEMCADPEVMRYIGNGTPRTREQTEYWVNQFRASWASDGFGLYAIEERSTGKMIGFSGFLIPAFLPEIMPSIEIGWRLKRETWGRGYATEAADAVLARSAPELGEPHIHSICHVDNIASERVMQKIGMQLDRETVVPDGDMPVRVYRADIS